MGLRGVEFDMLHSDNKAIVIRAKGIKVKELQLSEHYYLVLYSLNSFFVEAVLDKTTGILRCVERLSLDDVTTTYCEDIPSIEI